MPATLHPTIRHRVIDDCFQRKGKRWTWSELSEKCGEQLRELFTDRIDDPSRRTIMGDISLMKSGKLRYEAPIEYDKIEKGYYYTDPNFSILQSPLNPNDWILLKQAANILKQYRGFNQLLGIEEIVQRIEVGWSGQEKDVAPIIQFDHPLDNPGHQWLEPILRAIRKQKTLLINYQSFHLAEAVDSTFSPYLLKEYNKRWFLVGWRHEKERIEVRPLDRILAISSAKVKYHNSPTFNPSTYFSQAIGVTVAAKSKVQELRFLAIPEQAKYIKTKKIHGSQKIVAELETGTVFSCKLILNFELESLLLSFGERITVLKPVALRNKVARRLEEWGKLYEAGK